MVRRAARHCATALLLAAPAALLAQSRPDAAASGPPGRAAGAGSRVAARGELFAGSDLEAYLRALQVAGVATPYPWSLRAFSRHEIDSLLPRTLAHPWAARYDLDRAGAPAADWHGLSLLRPTLALRYNSTFPVGSNDGPVWAGRGLTTAVQVGVAGRWGPLSLTLAPMAFRAENEPFPLGDNGHDDRLAYAHVQYPTAVDQPQRFGAAAYQRVDPGQSTLRLDVAGVALGASTANMWWGPANRYPFLLGNNAAGFPHVFVGTQRPADLRIGRAHARVVWGRLDQSEYFDPTTDPYGITRERRFAAGLVALFEPRAIPGLELGGARFFHARWPDEGLPGRYLWRPLQTFIKEKLPSADPSIPGDHQSRDGENQLASAFGRWVLPRGGVEMYFEYGRDDHNWDRRDLLLEPDHQASLLWGLGKTWRRDDRRLAALRVEVLNYETKDVDAGRFAGVIYAHGSGANQGHTQRGQLLGADAGVGSGAGAVAAMDWYRPDGRWSASWTRVLRGRRDQRAPDGGPNERAMDVVHSIGVERLLFAGPWDVTAGVTGSYEFNRDFVADRRNLGVFLSIAGAAR